MKTNLICVLSFMASVSGFCATSAVGSGSDITDPTSVCKKAGDPCVATCPSDRRGHHGTCADILGGLVCVLNDCADSAASSLNP